MYNKTSILVRINHEVWNHESKGAAYQNVLFLSSQRKLLKKLLIFDPVLREYSLALNSLLLAKVNNFLAILFGPNFNLTFFYKINRALNCTERKSIRSQNFNSHKRLLIF